jgi:hypothetical protein
VRRRPWLAAAGIALALASGCGGEGDRNERETGAATGGGGAATGKDGEGVTRTVKAYYAALADGDAKKACEQYTRVARARATRTGGCERVIAEGTPAIPDENKAILRDIPVSGVAIRGASATVSVSAPTGPQTVILVREGGRWKIDRLSS